MPAKRLEKNRRAFLSNYLCFNFYFFLFRGFCASSRQILARPSPLDTRRCLHCRKKAQNSQKQHSTLDTGLSTGFIFLATSYPPPATSSPFRICAALCQNANGFLLIHHHPCFNPLKLSEMLKQTKFGGYANKESHQRDRHHLQ